MDLLDPVRDFLITSSTSTAGQQFLNLLFNYGRTLSDASMLYFAAFGRESRKGTGGVKKYAKFRQFLAHRVV